MTIERCLRGIAGLFCAAKCFNGTLSFAILAVFYRVCRFEFITVGLYELVPDDYHTKKAWC